MSTLLLDNIKTTANISKFLAHAWVNFDGTGTIRIRASGGVSSLTDNGVGKYSINFANNTTDNAYAICMSGGTATANGRLCNPVNSAPANTGPSVFYQAMDATGFDTDYCFISIYR